MSMTTIGPGQLQDLYEDSVSTITTGCPFSLGLPYQINNDLSETIILTYLGRVKVSNCALSYQFDLVLKPEYKVG